MHITILLARVGLSALAVVAFAASTAPLAAQMFATDDAVIKCMWRLGMNSSPTYKLAQQLLDFYGRRSGLRQLHVAYGP